MSANLWNASTANKKPDVYGVYICDKSSGLNCTNTVASALAEDTTIHMGASLRGADKGRLEPYVKYMDAEGNPHYVGFTGWIPTGQWQRFESSCVVPSGMTPAQFGFNASKATGDIEVANPTFSYGSPVPLAASAHTPYATQEYVDAENAKKADEADLQSLSTKVAANSALSMLYSDDKWRVCVKCGFVWVYCYGVSTGGGSWDYTDCPYTLPVEYRPHMSVRAPAVTANGGSYTGYVSVTSEGEISVSNFGGTGSTDARSGTLCYPIGI